MYSKKTMKFKEDLKKSKKRILGYIKKRNKRVNDLVLEVINLREENRILSKKC